MPSPTAPPIAEPSIPLPRPDLTRRYRLQVCFPEPGETERWDTINSFPTAIEALRGGSECYEAVKDLLGSDDGRELEPGYFKIRILDADSRRLSRVGSQRFKRFLVENQATLRDPAIVEMSRCPNKRDLSGDCEAPSDKVPSCSRALYVEDMGGFLRGAPLVAALQFSNRFTA